MPRRTGLPTSTATVTSFSFTSRDWGETVMSMFPLRTCASPRRSQILRPSDSATAFQRTPRGPIHGLPGRFPYVALDGFRNGEFVHPFTLEARVVGEVWDQMVAATRAAWEGMNDAHFPRQPPLMHWSAQQQERVMDLLDMAAVQNIQPLVIWAKAQSHLLGQGGSGGSPQRPVAPTHPVPFSSGARPSGRPPVAISTGENHNDSARRGRVRPRDEYEEVDDVPHNDRDLEAFDDEADDAESELDDDDGADGYDVAGGSVRRSRQRRGDVDDDEHVDLPLDGVMEGADEGSGDEGDEGEEAPRRSGAEDEAGDNGGDNADDGMETTRVRTFDT